MKTAGRNVAQNPVQFENFLQFEKAISKTRCMVTGHSGFTGGWLSLWLAGLGAEVTGISLPPATKPNLFEALEIDGLTNSYFCDIREASSVQRIFERAQPELVFHLAAQPIVGRAFDDPLETFGSNVMGTVNVLEAARQTESVRAIVCVTTDKVYEPQDWPWAYRENDVLGGKDPYSASKSAAELAVRAYQHSLFARANSALVATARGGNIIGGGDWSEGRIVPDFVRAHQGGSKLTLRNPTAVRPWQHVAALCHGYLVLADRLMCEGDNFADAWNFGPKERNARTVSELVEGLKSHWSGIMLDYENGGFPETQFLQVDSSKSMSALDWRPALDFSDTIRLTAEWYRKFYENPESARQITTEQLAYYRQEVESNK